MQATYKNEIEERLESASTLFSFSAAERLREQTGLDLHEMVAFIGISEKTYERRAKQGFLNEGESIKLEMLERTMETAAKVFPDEATARRWLHTPIISLEYRAPLELLTSIRGYERVHNTLMKIVFGVF